jgi:hypothetical protein
MECQISKSKYQMVDAFRAVIDLDAGRREKTLTAPPG